MIRDYTNLVVRIGFFTVVLLMLIVGGLSLLRYKNLYIELSEIVDINNRKIALVGTMRESIRQREVKLNSMLATYDPFENNVKFSEFVALSGMFRVARLELHELGMSDEEEILYEKLLDSVRKSGPRSYHVAELIVDEAPMAEIRLAMETAESYRREVLNRLGDLMNLQRKYALSTVRSAEHNNDSTTLFLIILGIVSVLVSMVIAMLVTKYVATRKMDISNKNQELMLTHKVKAEFLANMTHELRTPLNAIIGYSELLGDEVVDTELENSKKDLDKISGAGRHLLRMINEVLDMTKIEAGKMQVYQKRTSIKDLIHELKQNIFQFDAGHENTIKFIDKSNIESIITDSVKLSYMLSHILTNSCKFTKNGLIEFRVESSDDGIQFIIKDSGIGISEQRMENLFEPFVSENSIYTREHEGTGLGLAITKIYCDMLEGSIQVKSELGVGTEFIMTIPLSLSNKENDFLQDSATDHAVKQSANSQLESTRKVG